jgi:exonuclease SbcD
MMARLGINVGENNDINAQLEDKLTDIVRDWLDEADPDLPMILTAHATIQGAVYGGERTVMLGGDLVLSGGLVGRTGIDYTALGHIHKPQNLGGGPKPEEGQGTADTRKGNPPVIYPGSIERVDFGEAEDNKYYVIAEVERGQTNMTWHALKNIRSFITRKHEIKSDSNVMVGVLKALPPPAKMADAIVRLILEYPRDWEGLIDEIALREQVASAFEFQLVKRPQMESRIRLPEDQAIGSMTPTDLLEHYWKSAHLDVGEMGVLQDLARDVIEQVENGE